MSGSVGILGCKYNSDSEVSSDSEQTSTPNLPHPVNSAPDVGISSAVACFNVLDSSCKQIHHNVPYDAMMLPVVGPANPRASQNERESGRIGYAEAYAMGDTEFNEQMILFRRAEALCKAETTAKFQKVILGLPHLDEAAISTISLIKNKRKVSCQIDPNNSKLKRRDKGDVAILDGPGAYQGPWAEYCDSDDTDGTDDNLNHEDEISTDLVSQSAEIQGSDDEVLPKVQLREKLAGSRSRLITPGSEKTILHCKMERDYLGRTYMSPAAAISGSSRSNSTGLLHPTIPEECFIPKKCLYTYKGHSKGVNTIKLLPKTGHLLLSAGMDSKIKLWNAGGDHRVLRTFLGHNRAVRDICFDNTGERFLSASYDRYIKLWDTETGKCLHSFTTGRIPLCVTFNPDPDYQNIFLSGQQDNRIYQFDIRTGETTQEYNQHLGPVNTVTFIDENRRFVTTSDDKSLRVWEFGIPTVIKYIAEPHMHSMPAVSLSPNKQWLACQSLDNQILIYQAGDRFRLNSKRSFRGHIVAGYACQVDISPDSRYVISGDSTGHMYYWNYKTSKLLKRQKAHDNVVMGCLWHPYETSKVYTCSWDGTIKLWD